MLHQAVLPPRGALRSSVRQAASRGHELTQTSGSRAFCERACPSGGDEWPMGR